MKKSIIYSMLFCLFLFSCKKNNVLGPDVNLLIKEDAVQAKVAVATNFSAGTNNGQAFQHEWKLDGKVVSTIFNYNFIAAKAGTYVLAYKGYNEAGEFTHTYTITVPVPVVGITPTSSKYISRILDYLPAPGQFVNETLGKPEQAQKLIGSTTNLILVATLFLASTTR